MVATLGPGEVPERLNGPVLKTGARKCRGFESHPLRHRAQAALFLLVGFALAGCSIAGFETAKDSDAPRDQYFQLALPGADGAGPVPMQVADTMEMVTRADIDLRNPPLRGVDAAPFVGPVPGRDDALLVGWPGGCEERADLALERSEFGPNLTLKLVLRRGGCDAAIVARRVIVTFDAPVQAGDFNLDVVQ